MYSLSSAVTNQPLTEWSKDVANISVEPISSIERGSSVNERMGG